MINDATLGGYLTVHARSPAFEGADGQAYSVAVYVEENPDEQGRYGGALLFIRWSPSGEQPTGHVETDYLAFGHTPAESEERLRALSLHEVKEELDRAIHRTRELPSW